MKRAFTLVEMLIVVVILAVLMTMVFRLGSLGGSDWRRTETIVKLQKIENCLSGYYAAFGSYPPVKVHGYRDITMSVDKNGDQTESNAGGGNLNSGSGLVWAQVEAACRSQPFGCEYPPCEEDTTDENGNKVDSEKEVIEDWAEEVSKRVGNSTDYPKYAGGTWDFASLFGGKITGPSYTDLSSERDNASWHKLKLFKFGVMSFLLPRYLFMMNGNEHFVAAGETYAQWGDNNDLPARPDTGEPFNSWKEMRDQNQISTAYAKKSRNQLALVANIPSQAACARWMPNLETICATLKKMVFFGVNISGSTGLSAGWEGDDGEIYPPDPQLHSLDGGKSYRNASVTIRDGWSSEFYYYSPPPYQTYTVWSSGPNYKTFPPWMTVDKLDSTDRKTAMEWKSDDILQMSH